MFSRGQRHQIRNPIRSLVSHMNGWVSGVADFILIAVNTTEFIYAATVNMMKMALMGMFCHFQSSPESLIRLRRSYFKMQTQVCQPYQFSISTLRKNVITRAGFDAGILDRGYKTSSLDSKTVAGARFQPPDVTSFP